MSSPYATALAFPPLTCLPQCKVKTTSRTYALLRHSAQTPVHLVPCILGKRRRASANKDLFSFRTATQPQTSTDPQKRTNTRYTQDRPLLTGPSQQLSRGHLPHHASKGNCSVRIYIFVAIKSSEVWDRVGNSAATNWAMLLLSSPLKEAALTKASCLSVQPTGALGALTEVVGLVPEIEAEGMVVVCLEEDIVTVLG